MTTDTISPCSLVTLFADPELPERKKLKLQQGQCLIRLLDKQVGLLQQLIATTNSRASSPAPAERLPGCNMTTAQSVSVTQGTAFSNTQHDNCCEHARSDHSSNVHFLLQNQFREKVNAATQKIMWQKGFYPGGTKFDLVAMFVLSKTTLAAAKADYQLYCELIKKVSKAHKGC